MVCKRFPHLVTLATKKSTTSRHAKNEKRRLSLSSTFSISSSDSSSLMSMSGAWSASTASVDRITASEKSTSVVVDEIPWMPTLVLGNDVFLGRREQADDHRVVSGLGITHIVSIGR